jgi:hypothetical protein
MNSPPDVDYTVVLVFPGFGTERENAETIVESALEWLNTYKDEPGFRFAPQVSAHLEIVSDVDEARARIEADESVATVILHDVAEDERIPLLRFCEAREISACYTVDVPRRPGPRKGPMKVVIRSKPANEVPAHRLAGETLTGPVDEEDEDTQGRIGEVIAVLALGVMEHHWRQNPPSFGFSPA